MQTEVILSGFGGQGIMFAGQVLTYAAMDAGKDVTWIPSYGPEMRGGTANCTVVIADEEIGSPVVKNPDVALVMNLPSLDKYEPLVKEGGMLIINASMVDRQATRKDISVINIPCNTMAEEMGNSKLANMVAVGALLKEKRIVGKNIDLTKMTTVKACRSFLVIKPVLKKTGFFFK